jgi:quinol monooxygenase YgiN
MAFVQIIEMRTSKVEEMQRVGEEWEAAVGDDRTARRRVFCQDRDNPDRYFNIVFFDSYESAMQNSEHPTTQEFSKRMAELVDGEPTFYNLDVLDERG